MTFILDALRSLADNPILLLILIAGPFLVISRFFSVVPTRRLLGLFAIPCSTSIFLLLNESIYPLVLGADAIIVLVVAYDLLTVPKASDFEVERDCQRVASLKQSHDVSIVVTNRSLQKREAFVTDGTPQEFQIEPDEFAVDLHPRSRIALTYKIRATRRGAFDLDVIHLCVRSRLKLWNRYLRYPHRNEIHVYPDMKQMSEYALLAKTNRLSLLGVRRTRRIGQDNDFERLRDYTLDDNYRHIDWRSTARRNKLTVRDFQTSQSQRVVFLLDCGRMMTNVASGISLLDHSLNAILMLSYVALERGDSVGLITFSDKIHSFVPAHGGRSQMNRLLHASFDRFPDLVESRYDQAFLYLNTRFRKRSLVVLVTNVIDEVNSRQVQQHLTGITGRHLPIGVFLRDHQLFDAAEANQPTGTALFRSGAAAEILMWRREVITDLQHKGVLSLDLFPESMTAPLINKYLEIKARNLL